MPGKLTLTITTGPRTGQTFTFDEHDTLLCGRMADCHLCLPENKTVSRHHFLLEVNPPEARIRDLGSLSGTMVNGKKYGGREKQETPEEGAKRQYPQVDLHDGDEITVGTLVLRVQIELKERAAEPVRCQRCGKEISAEIAQAEGDILICSVCCQRATPGPEDLLHTHQQPPQALAQIGVPLSDYHLIREVGKGGMGAVYLVQHTRTGQQAALKTMLSKVAVSDSARQQFLREMEQTRAFQHPHLISFLDGGSQGGLFYFLLEFCEGGDVAQLMQRRGGRLALEEAGPILLQALAGLAFLHQQGVVHRDLKPQNLLLKGEEGRWNTKVSDLGLAKSFEQAGFSGMTATGNYAGSFPFMPREQVINFKFFKPVSDIWAMGATGYYLLTGFYPRNYQRGQDPLFVILQDEIIPLRTRDPHLPAPVAEVIDRALATQVSERYQDGGEMYEALAQALQKEI